MNSLREYRMPLFIAGGALVVALILWVGLISPQKAKLSSLQAQQTQLQAKEVQLRARLAALQSEGQKLSSNCADLVRISTQIPSVQTPTDLDAEESTFETQFNDLAGLSGVTLAQFSGFTPAGATASGAVATTTPTSTGATPSPAGVTAVPTSLTVQGNAAQIGDFVSGLDNFPRLFVIQKFVLSFGQAASAGSGTGATSAVSGSSSSAVPTGGTPLWVGGAATPPASGPYNLQIAGSIYYTSTPNALDACTKATAAQASTK